MDIAGPRKPWLPILSHALFAGNAAKARSEGEPHDESRRVFNALERGRAMNGSKAPDFSVAGQHVLVSGGAGGIGTAFSRAFRDSGAIVTITDIKSPANDESLRFEQLDVRDDAAVEALAAKIDTLHVLIHCAGRLIRHEEHKPEVFRDIIDIHLVGNLRSGGRATRPGARLRYIFSVPPSSWPPSQ